MKSDFIDFHTHSIKPDQIQFFMASDKIPTIKGSYFFLGIHPWDINIADWQKQLGQLKSAMLQAIENSQFLGLGEIGLDKVKGPEFSLQNAAFRDQIKLAQEFGLNRIVLHNVKTYNESYQALRDLNYEGVIILHDFYKDLKVFKQYLRSFPRTYISIGQRGIKSRLLHDFPLEKCLLETDDSDLQISTIYREASERLNLDIKDLTQHMHNRLEEILL